MKSNNSPFSVEHADESTGFLLWQVTSLWQREIRKTLEPFDLTHSQFVLLASAYWLTLQKQEVTQILLSQHTKIDPMTTSQVLRILQRKGFIQRTEHFTDTRAKLVSLTGQGTEVITKAVVEVETFDRHFFSVLQDEVPGFNRQLLKLLGDRK
ncbi:MAG: MarR family transcriptional regulator [Ignavibacteria bacterium]|nr:MarR family transcriptional regulator [Ignavibacteria bacterium]